MSNFLLSFASLAQIDDFASDSNGLRLIEAFMRIDNGALRRRIVMLVQELASDDGLDAWLGVLGREVSFWRR